MAEENQQQMQQGPTGPTVPAEPQQGTTKEPQRVTTKDPKKIEAGKRLAEINCKKREEQTQLEKTTSGVNQYYGIGAVIALGVIGGLGYYIYRIKKGEEVNMAHNPTISQPLPCLQVIATQPPSGAHPAQTNKFDMD